MMMRRSLLVITACVVCSSSTVVACVKDDPIITGNRDASADARPVPVVALADEPDEDAPGCRHCAETLSTESSRGTLCRKNGTPSSARLLNDVVDCVCYDKCVQECGNYCTGGPQDSPCQTCIVLQCTTPVNACAADKKGS